MAPAEVEKSEATTQEESSVVQNAQTEETQEVQEGEEGSVPQGKYNKAITAQLESCSLITRAWKPWNTSVHQNTCRNRHYPGSGKQ